MPENKTVDTRCHSMFYLTSLFWLHGTHCFSSFMWFCFKREIIPCPLRASSNPVVKLAVFHKNYYKLKMQIFVFRFRKSYYFSTSLNIYQTRNLLVYSWRNCRYITKLKTEFLMLNVRMSFVFLCVIWK